jgi:ABC-type multidrug transport system fused ATPase/permease subunit
VIGDGHCQLSQGQRQRLSMARHLIRDAPAIILDESTSSQDSITTNHLQRAIQDLSFKKPVVIIAHRLRTIMGVECILVMHDGAVVEMGTHDTLLGNPNSRYAELWNKETKDAQDD